MKKIVIYSKDNCPYCTQAEKLTSQLAARDKSLQWFILKLGYDYTTNEWKMLFPEAKTYPQIVVDGENIGGWTEFQELVMNQF